MTDTPKTVVQAISAIMEDMPAIAKGDKAPAAMGGFAFRGIESMTRSIQPLLAKHGLVIVPSSRITQTLPAPGQKEGWQDVYLVVDWVIAGPDGSTLNARTNGIGRDQTDRGANKAATQAYKYLLLQLFCVSDSADDGDGQEYEQGEPLDARPEVPFGKTLFDQLKASDDVKLKALLRQFAADNGKSLTEKALAEDEAWAHTVLEAIEKYQADQGDEALAAEAERSEAPKVKLGGASKKRTATDVAAEAVAEAFPGTTEVKE